MQFSFTAEEMHAAAAEMEDWFDSFNDETWQ